MTLRAFAVAFLLLAGPARAELPIFTPAAGVSFRPQPDRSTSPCAELALHLGWRDDLPSRWGPDAFAGADLRLGLTIGSRNAGSLDAGVGASWGFGRVGRNLNQLRISLRPSIVVRTDGAGVAAELGTSPWPLAGIVPLVVRYDRYWRWDGRAEQLVSVLVEFDLGLLAGYAMSS